MPPRPNYRQKVVSVINEDLRSVSRPITARSPGQSVNEFSFLLSFSGVQFRIMKIDQTKHSNAEQCKLYFDEKKYFLKTIVLIIFSCLYVSNSLSPSSLFAFPFNLRMFPG